LTSFVVDDDTPSGFLAAAGFRLLAGRAVRVDIAERIDSILHQSSLSGTPLFGQVVSLLGTSVEEAEAVSRALGWQRSNDKWRPLRRQGHKARARKQKSVSAKAPASDSPFASLASLIAD
jgi:hypothetical protein